MSASGEPNRIADIIENSKNRTRELREILLRTLEPIVEELVHYMVKECVSRDYFQFIISLPVSSETNYSHSFVDKLYSAARSSDLGISPNTIFGQLRNDRSNHRREYRARAVKHAFDSATGPGPTNAHADRVFQQAKLLLSTDNGVDWPFDSDIQKRFFHSGDYELLMSLITATPAYERYLIDHPDEFTAEIGQTVMKKSDSELVNWSDFENVLKRIFSFQKGRFTEHKGVFHNSYFSTFVRESDWGTDMFRIPNVPSGFEEGDIPLFEISSDFEEFNVLSDHYEQFQMDSVEKNSNVEPEETYYQELETVEVGEPDSDKRTKSHWLKKWFSKKEKDTDLTKLEEPLSHEEEEEEEENEEVPLPKQYPKILFSKITEIYQYCLDEDSDDLTTDETVLALEHYSGARGEQNLFFVDFS